MFKFKIVDRETYWFQLTMYNNLLHNFESGAQISGGTAAKYYTINNLVDLCNKVLAKNDELLSMASKIHKFNTELIEFNKKLLKHNDEIIEFNENLLNLNGISVKKENENAEN